MSGAVRDTQPASITAAENRMTPLRHRLARHRPSFRRAIPRLPTIPSTTETLSGSRPCIALRDCRSSADVIVDPIPLQGVEGADDIREAGGEGHHTRHRQVAAGVACLLSCSEVARACHEAAGAACSAPLHGRRASVEPRSFLGGTRSDRPDRYRLCRPEPRSGRRHRPGQRLRAAEARRIS